MLLAPTHGAEVLVVDDDPTNRMLLERILQGAGYVVRTVDDGPAALRAVDECCPALVVLDYVMPGMDGPEVLERMRARVPGLPVLILTASSSPDHVDAAFAAGADDYIQRPVNPRILLHRVASHLRHDRTRRFAEEAHATGSALQRELEEASRVQRAQLPPVPQRWARWRGTGAVIAGAGVGGDVFGLMTGPFALPLAVLIDVAGHGVAAALVASRVQSELRTLLRDQAPADALAAVDQRLGPDGPYACVAALRLHVNTVEIVNAGLPPVALIRDGQIVASVAGSGYPPGLVGGGSYRATVLPVEEGDRVVVLSDGLTEPFGHADAIEEPLTRLDLFRSAPLADDDRSAWEQRIEEALGDVPDKLRDDATAVVLERWG
ncbi:MAG: response regulator [Myxococcota bacterium]